jgi:hypothetical protein
LTTLRIDVIVPAMRRKLAVLLIVGWVILSCFDVLEDLEFPGGATVSGRAHDPSSASSTAGWGALANNIVESAYRTAQTYVDVFYSLVLGPDRDAIPIFRTHFQLHKLYRVFLI